MKDVPRDYYQQLHATEQTHWWYEGMHEIAAALLADRLERPRLSLLDAGCGTGGFLEWVAGRADVERLCGVDISAEAIAYARETVPEADLHVAPLHALPYDAGMFDVVTLADVLQHIEEEEEEPTLRELRRVLRAGGALLVRTNGGRRPRRERSDWRLYSASVLRSRLSEAGFRVERITHANLALSSVARLRGRAPRAPTESRHGIPPPAGTMSRALGSRTLRLESAYMRRGGSLPWGHTLFAVAIAP